METELKHGFEQLWRHIEEIDGVRYVTVISPDKLADESAWLIRIRALRNGVEIAQNSRLVTQKTPENVIFWKADDTLSQIKAKVAEGIPPKFGRMTLPTIQLGDEALAALRNMSDKDAKALFVQKARECIAAWLFTPEGEMSIHAIWNRWLKKHGYMIGTSGDAACVISTQGDNLGLFETYEQALEFVLHRIDADMKAAAPETPAS
jgi:hypothetical protein